MQVRRLQSHDDFERYVDFSEEVYRQNPYWIPPDRHHLISVLSGEGQDIAQCRVQPFCVERDGRIVAALTAVVDDVYNRHWNERTGHLLFFEAMQGFETDVAALFGAAFDWLRTQGCEAARASFLYGWQLPWTIDAYDAVPTAFHTYNPPYYHSYAKNAGFSTEHGMVQYEITFTPELAGRYRDMIASATAGGITLRSWDFERLNEESTLFAELLNDTFGDHWGAPRFSAPQMQGFAAAMKDLGAPPDFFGFAEAERAAVGFVFALPDLNQALHRTRGKPAPDSTAEFSRALQEIDHGVLLIIGVEEDQRGRGISLALAARVYLAMIERGYKSASYTVVLDDNWSSRRTAEKLGGYVARNFIIYRKELSFAASR